MHLFLSHSLLNIPSHDHSTNASVISYDAVQLIESSSPRSRSDSNRFGLARVSLPHHIYRFRSEPEPTYINLHSDPPKCEPVCAMREHNTPPPCATPGGFTRWVHATLTISHAQCAVVFSHNRIAEVSGLPEYVTSTTSHNHKRPYKDRSLIDTDRTSSNRQPCWL